MITQQNFAGVTVVCTGDFYNKLIVRYTQLMKAKWKYLKRTQSLSKSFGNWLKELHEA